MSNKKDKTEDVKNPITGDSHLLKYPHHWDPNTNRYEAGNVADEYMFPGGTDKLSTLAIPTQTIIAPQLQAELDLEKTLLVRKIFSNVTSPIHVWVAADEADTITEFNTLMSTSINATTWGYIRDNLYALLFNYKFCKYGKFINDIVVTTTDFPSITITESTYMSPTITNQSSYAIANIRVQNAVTISTDYIGTPNAAAGDMPEGAVPTSIKTGAGTLKYRQMVTKIINPNWTVTASPTYLDVVGALNFQTSSAPTTAYENILDAVGTVLNTGSTAWTQSKLLYADFSTYAETRLFVIHMLHEPTGTAATKSVSLIGVTGVTFANTNDINLSSATALKTFANNVSTAADADGIAKRMYINKLLIPALVNETLDCLEANQVKSLKLAYPGLITCDDPSVSLTTGNYLTVMTNIATAIQTLYLEHQPSDGNTNGLNFLLDKITSKYFPLIYIYYHKKHEFITDPLLYYTKGVKIGLS